MTSLTDQLEALIDQYGLLHVTTGIELVCREKAEHFRVNWQDNSSAKRWERAAQAYYNAVGKVDAAGLHQGNQYTECA